VTGRSVADTLAWILVCWYATIPSFWLIIHPFPEYWRKHASPYRVILPAWFMMIVTAAALTWRWRSVRLYDAPWTWILFFFFAAGAVVFYHGSGKHISGQQVMGKAEVQPEKHEQRLVTTGMHGRVRHPMYAGHLLMMTGWTVGSGLAACFALTAFAVVTGLWMMRFEEKELEQRFGEEYREYKKKVPALLPRLR
jgi:protein-S-isoprenylcysteine O-methyltransferase Ste14